MIKKWIDKILDYIIPCRHDYVSIPAGSSVVAFGQIIQCDKATIICRRCGLAKEKKQ